MKSLTTDFSRHTGTFSKLTSGIVFFFLVAAASAQSTGTGQGQKEFPATVKYLGIQEDMVVFNISCPNPEGNKFSLTLKDQDGIPLYQNVFSEKGFYKQFRLPKTDKNKITFVLRNGREAEVAKSFEINVNSRFVEDIAIKKID
jgi:hypothetical protein